VPLVLTSNNVTVGDRYNYKDVTGEQYHYPNGYRGMFRLGEKFVYYRGTRRANGGRGQAEYFGSGVIGAVWRDPTVSSVAPKKNWAWYCRIEDYIPFPRTVPAKIDGVSFEDIPQNMWRNGVRKISTDAFSGILAAAGIPSLENTDDPAPAFPELPDIDAIEIQEAGANLMAAPRNMVDELGSPGSTARRSRTAKMIGDRAEEIAAKYIRQRVPAASAIRHVAAEGETPGWDLEYKDADGVLHAVEVKGSFGCGFVNFDMTDGELAAARRLENRYWIYLVSDCCSLTPKVQRIQNPAAMVDCNVLVAKPIAWRIWRM
jgi:uncharacterized protein DUF3883